MKENKITKEDFFKLDEKDLMFITSPGRMGDVDGSTFVIRKDDKYTMYHVGGWYNPKVDEKDITLDDMFKVFPEWRKTLIKQSENYSGKYVFIPMGFGNGLCVDKSVYDEYHPYLLEQVKKHETYSEEDGKDYNICLNYPSWIPALEKMLYN